VTSDQLHPLLAQFLSLGDVLCDIADGRDGSIAAG
jgi:hypothetical protein